MSNKKYTLKELRELCSDLELHTLAPGITAQTCGKGEDLSDTDIKFGSELIMWFYVKSSDGYGITWTSSSLSLKTEIQQVKDLLILDDEAPEVEKAPDEPVELNEPTQDPVADQNAANENVERLETRVSFLEGELEAEQEAHRETKDTEGILEGKVAAYERLIPGNFTNLSQ